MEDIFSYTDNFKIYKDVKSYLLWGDVIFTPNPKVSIIMPIFNHPDFFKDALESAINQDCNDIYEIVIVDNTDYSEEPTINQKIVEELNNSRESLNELKNKLKKLKEKVLCYNCNEKRREVIYRECNHLVLCEDCHRKRLNNMQKKKAECPICNKISKIFFIILKK